MVVALLMTVAVVGCATQSGTSATQSGTSQSSGTGQASAPTAINGEGGGATVLPVSETDGARVMSQMSARPRLGDFVVHEAIRDIHFDFDRYEIRPVDAKILEASAQWLKAHPDHLLVIEGHADERGTNEYNIALGERRAKSSLNYLVSHGIQATRITVLSYGEERNVCREKTESCWGKNRRAHFLVKPR